MWDTLSAERMGLSFVYAAGPCQLSLSRIRVPWDLWRYFALSDETSLFVASYDLQCHSGGIWPCLHTELHSAGLGSLLYSLEADPTESTASNSTSTVVMGGCLEIVCTFLFNLLFLHSGCVVFLWYIFLVIIWMFNFVMCFFFNHSSLFADYSLYIHGRKFCITYIAF
jgi:hypothetical protein